MQRIDHRVTTTHQVRTGMSDMRKTKVDDELAAIAAEWFERLHQETATEQDFQAWLQWLHAAPEHLRAYREIERIWRLLGEVEPAAWTGAASQLDSASRSPFRPSWQARSWPLALAGAVLVSVLAIFLYVHLSGGREIEYATGVAEQRSIRLPDGSKVVLGPMSRVAYRFNDDARDIALTAGEVFFDVAHDPQRPFVVAAGERRIRAIGTSFNVLAGMQRLVVSVVEGKVSVSNVAGSAAAAARNGAAVTAPDATRRTDNNVVMLDGGEQAAILSDGQVAIERDAFSASATDWLYGRRIYRGEPLRNVVEDINRYTTRPIVLKDSAAGMLRYSGTVFPDHLDEWLEAISEVLPVTIRETNGQREIYMAAREVSLVPL